MSVLSRFAVKAAKELAERGAKPLAAKRAKTWVRTSELPPSVKADLADAVGAGRFPEFARGYADFHGADPRDADVAAELFEPTDAPYIALGKVPTQNISAAKDRQVSPQVVARYAAMPSRTAPPLLVRKTGTGYQLVEGGHRLAAAKARGDAYVPIADMSSLGDLDWDAHMSGAATYAAPTKKARGGLAVKRGAD
jgi:hypothetical protein